MAFFLWQNSFQQFFDQNGDPLSGGKLYFFAAGTTTKVPTYTTNVGNIPNTNPLILDASGYTQQAIWLTGGTAVKVGLTLPTEPDPPTNFIPPWPLDNVKGIGDNTAVVLEWLASGFTPTYISATSFSVPGDQTSVLPPRIALKIVDAGGTKYGWVKTSVFGAVTTITLDQNSAALASPISSVAYGILSPTNPSEPIYADTFPVRSSAADESKQIGLDASGITTGTTRRLKAQDRNITLADNATMPIAINGRLTLTSGLPVTISDVTGTNIYFTPYKGNRIWLYNGTVWNTFSFAELTLAVPATTNTMYDVFAYINAGAVAIESLAWTNDTTRATALVLQDGVYSKTGDLTRRYLGTFRTNGVSGQTEDSLARRYVFNYDNRAQRPMLVQETTDQWNYTVAVLRQANANTANQLDMVIGLADQVINAEVYASSSNGTANVVTTVGIGLDSTTTDNSSFRLNTTYALGASTGASYHTQYKAIIPAGRHTLVWVEASTATDTTTWFGDHGGVNMQSGIFGDFWA